MRMKRAFSYDWRLWSLVCKAEKIMNCLASRAPMKWVHKVTFYWQGFDEDGEPDGVFLPVREGEADAGWICYITAEK